jgi:hypothetical protein
MKLLQGNTTINDIGLFIRNYRLYLTCYLTNYHAHTHESRTIRFFHINTKDTFYITLSQYTIVSIR